MLTVVGFALLFFLPVFESFDRHIAMMFLLSGSILIYLPFLFEHKIRFHTMERIFLAFLLILGITTVFSWAPLRSFTEFLRYCSYFLLFVAIRRFPDRKILVTRFFIPMIFANSAILSALYVLSTVPGLLLVAPPLSGMNLFYPSFGHNRLAELLLFAIPFPVAYLSHVKNKVLKLFCIELIVLLLIVMLASSARGAILALAFAFVLTAYFKKTLTKSFALMTGIIVGGAVLLLAASFIYSNIVSHSSVPVIAVLYKPAGRELRFDYIRQAMIGFMHSPLVGTGLDTFRYVSQKYRFVEWGFSDYAHNHYLELFAETGVVGGIVFLLLVGTVFYHIKPIFAENGKRMYLSHACFIAALASVFHNLLDYDWHYISLFLFFWFCAAVIVPKHIESVHSEREHLFSQTVFLFITSLAILYSLFHLDADFLMKRATAEIDIRNFEAALGKFLFIAKYDSRNSFISDKIRTTYLIVGDTKSAAYWSVQRKIRYEFLNIYIDN
jgi:O-antigen ligase